MSFNVTSSQVAALSGLLSGSVSAVQNLLLQNLKIPRTRHNKAKVDSLKENSAQTCSSENAVEISKLLLCVSEMQNMFKITLPKGFQAPKVTESLGKIDPYIQESNVGSSNEDLGRSLSENLRKCTERGKVVQLWSGNGINVSMNCRSGTLYMQQRGFRSRVTQIGLGGMSDRQTAGKSLGSIWDVLNPNKQTDTQLADIKKLIEKATVTGDKTGATRDDLNAMFTEGYLAGRKQKEEEKTEPQLGKKLFKFFFWTFVFYVIYRMVTGDVRVERGSGIGGLLMGSSNNEVAPEDVNVSFADVKGIEEAKEEVMEIVEYLRDPEKFSRLGARLPKGILLVGQPGCGKTLLARAIAGEAGVPFFHASGSEFDEVLVGQGAKRVRDLFAQAKARSPAVIFIDEVDSVGAKRVSTAIHPYANQTINQLLNEMDGFAKNEGIIVLAATNRRDDLDRALLRPGRFDVEVTIPIPDLRGRKEILKLYLDKVITNDDLDLETLAKGTTGFTGADIENMVNQGALRAAADGMKDVSMAYLESARDKVLMGPEKKNRIPDFETNRNTAYHEAGHTLVAFYTKDATPLHKVTIIPRGGSLGMTQMMPDKDSYQLTKSQLLAQMDVAMGGRAAEELVLGAEKVTTGAANDLQGATNLATQMVKTFGMSDKVGLRKFEEGGSQSVFFPTNEHISEVTSDAIDSEIKRLLHESFERAKDILKSHSKELKRLAESLIDRETLSADEIKNVIEGKPLSDKS